MVELKEAFKRAKEYMGDIEISKNIVDIGNAWIFSSVEELDANLLCSVNKESGEVKNFFPPVDDINFGTGNTYKKIILE